MRTALLLALVVIAAGCGGGSPRRTSPAPRTNASTAARPSRRRWRRPRRHDRPVPILEYHVIGTPAPSAPNPQLYVAPAAFAAQLGWLARGGWHPVTIDDVLAYWRTGRPLPPKPIALTFDDGYPSDWRIALPDLRARGWAANLNLQVGNLVPLHVRQLHAGGWEVDAHTFTHPDLTTLGADRLAHEVGGSRSWIRRLFHVAADAFAYPAGREDAAVRAAVRRAGFRAAETEAPGWASPRDGLLALDRLEVTRATQLRAFAWELARPWG